MAEVKIVKLITGEEILAQLRFFKDLELQENMVELKNPVKLGVTQEGVALVPFIMGSKKDKTIKVKQSQTLCITEPEDELKNGYNSQFGHGIVVARSNVDSLVANDNQVKKGLF